jgi:hypothetical protein
MVRFHPGEPGPFRLPARAVTQCSTRSSRVQRTNQPCARGLTHGDDTLARGRLWESCQAVGAGFGVMGLRGGERVAVHLEQPHRAGHRERRRADSDDRTDWRNDHIDWPQPDVVAFRSL